MALGTEIKTTIIMTIAVVIIVATILIGTMGMPWYVPRYLSDANEIKNQPLQQQLVNDCFARAKQYTEQEELAQYPEDKQYYQQLKESFLAQCNLEKQQAQ